MSSDKKRPRFTYSEEDMENALRAVQAEGLSKRKASIRYKVPRTTLTDKLLGNSQRGRRMGHVPYLTEREESDIVQ